MFGLNLGHSCRNDLTQIWFRSLLHIFSVSEWAALFTNEALSRLGWAAILRMPDWPLQAERYGKIT